MLRNPKRYRQITLFESFGHNKKPKANNSDMEKVTEVQESTSETQEENISVAPSPASQDPLEICQAVENSLQIKQNNDTDDDKKSDEADLDIVLDNFSDDLFPTEPSQEDHSVPSSSTSQELFTDCNYELSKYDSENILSLDETDQTPILNRMPDCCLPLPVLKPSENHSIMFSPHVRPFDAPRPYPKSYIDKWDCDHVRMPCSPLNRCAVENSYGEKVIENRWDIVCRSLRRDIGSSMELQEAIMAYNPQHIEKWNFISLHTFINHHLKEEEQDHFFETLLPAMVTIALDLPKICTQPIPLLKTGKDHYVTMTQKQIGCLLLNAFFCTFPRRTYPNNKKQMRYKWSSEYASYPEINFNRLFSGYKGDKQTRKMEKIKCLINYFKRIVTKEPSGTVTFHRQVISDRDLPNWSATTNGIRTAVIRSSGLIEADGYGMLQVDFANKYIGGGILGQGCVQEEIRFAICPELIVSCLFVERLDRHEALIVTGVEQYNKYSGYADSFKWEGDFQDKVFRDSWGRKCTQLVAIDAVSFRNSEVQFELPYIKRELNKAYSGFYENEIPAHLPAVATGNWGCGVFKGNPHVKFIVQLMAASLAGRGLVYFTFGNRKLKTELKKIYDFMDNFNITLSECWRILKMYSDYLREHLGKEHYSFYNYFCFKIMKEAEKDNEHKLDLQNDLKMLKTARYGGSENEDDDI